MKNLNPWFFCWICGCLLFIQCKKEAVLHPGLPDYYAGLFYVQGNIHQNNTPDSLEIDLLTGVQDAAGVYYYVDCTNPVSAGLKLLTSTMYRRNGTETLPVIAFNFNSKYDSSVPNSSLWTQAEIDNWFQEGKQIPFGWADGKVWIRFENPLDGQETYRSFENLNQGNFITIEAIEDIEWQENGVTYRGKMVTLYFDSCTLQSSNDPDKTMDMRQTRAKVFVSLQS